VADANAALEQRTETAMSIFEWDMVFLRFLA
jgi:hypothetical protein